MENQTRFDLNAAMENWRQELTAQVSLTAEVRRELETHLRDAIAGFQQRGLNDEESFWLARRRAGQPHQLGEECVKANPATVWREWVLWFTTVLFGFTLWQKICDCLWTLFDSDIIPDWVRFYIPLWLESMLHSLLFLQGVYFSVHYLPLICFAIYVTRGRIGKVRLLWHFLSESRLRFVFLALVLVLMVYSLNAAIDYHLLIWRFPGISVWAMLVNMVFSASWPLTLIAMITWLLPAQNRKTPKSA